MTFLTQGDYIFPFQAIYFWLEHVFVWSFQTGAPNLESIIRLPARLIYLVFFQLFGNVATSYFFLFSSLLIIFACFYYFGRQFFSEVSRGWITLAALLFTFNPIFLGNIAKLGLIIGVAMLPLGLAFIRQAFVKNKPIYLLLYVFTLNVALVHPYNFTLTFLFSASYLLVWLFRKPKFVTQNLWRLVGLGALAVLMNLYFILPIAQLGTISKTALSQQISTEPVDYTQLVSISNTGDLFTALSLSKNVFKDFEFYSETYRPIYFVAVFLLYAILLGGFVLAAKRIDPLNKRRFALSFGIVLILMLLSTAATYGVAQTINFFIGLPGGWMFRSPLKWQLYMPFFLSVAILAVLPFIKQLNWRRGAYGALVLAIIGMSGYLTVDIGKKLLTPRQLQTFAALQEIDMQNKNLLLVDTPDCALFWRENPTLFSELNQVLMSKQVQVKHITAAGLETINISDYDFLMGCPEGTNPSDLQSDAFVEKFDYSNGAFKFFENTKPKSAIFTFDSLYKLADNARRTGQKRNLIEGELNGQFNFTQGDDSLSPSIGLYDLFEEISANNIVNQTINTSLTTLTSAERMLVKAKEAPAVSAEVKGNQVFLSSDESAETAEVSLPGSGQINATYQDSNIKLSNLISNGSLEEGLWRDNVGDCYNYDNKPAIDQKLITNSRTDGSQSLQLEATRHVACTGPPEASVEPGESYILSFDYQSPDGPFAGYHAAFNDADQTVMSEQFAPENSGWQHFTSVITAPEDATKFDLLLYAYPNDAGTKPSRVRYDNLRLTPIPRVQGSYFALDKRSDELKQPASLEFDIKSPTKKLVKVHGATTAFYLGFRDTYHPQWRLRLSGRVLDNNNHIHLNNYMNGWYIDPAEFCADSSACTKNSDGSNDLNLTIEFAPQRWFEIGLVISSLTFLGFLGFVIVSRSRHIKTYRVRT